MILIQCAAGQQRDLLRIVAVAHSAYCKKFGIEYRCVIEQGWPSRAVMTWRRYSLILEALNGTPDGMPVAYLDNDSLIVNHAENIFEALKEGDDLGVVRSDSRMGEFNSGVIFVTANEKTRAFFAEVIRRGPLPPPNDWKDQTVFCAVLRTSGLALRELNPRYNYYKNAKGTLIRPIIIRSWHDLDKRVVKRDIMNAVEGMGFEVKRGCGGCK